MRWVRVTVAKRRTSARSTSDSFRGNGTPADILEQELAERLEAFEALGLPT
jgi:hypothetical protein